MKNTKMMNIKETIEFVKKESEFMDPMAAAFFKLNVLNLIVEKSQEDSE